MDTSLLIDRLNHPDCEERLDALRGLAQAVDLGALPSFPTGRDVNNHIHTQFSFSPYSPSKAVWTAANAGLATAGIVDHDSVGGILEFHEAGKILGLATTGGLELRVRFSATPVEGRRINNPDQCSIAYMTMHGVPIQSIGIIERFLKPLRNARNQRNRKMCERLNILFERCSLLLDFDRDVLPISKHSEGGSVTERHLLFALSHKLIGKFGRGSTLLSFLQDELKLTLSQKTTGWLADPNNPHYDYDLLGALKSDLVPKFYIDADAECPDVRQALALCRRAGAISAYAYLGDVGDSVTGDKRAQKFEDDYLEELFDTLGDLGFDAVTYMPSRNTAAQLFRLKELCNRHGLFQISGEDINSPRQEFICMAARAPEFTNLIDSTWALIGHEKAVKRGLDNGMFSDRTKAVFPDLFTRCARYVELAEL